MKLPAIPVHSFEDATLNAEFLEQLGVLGSVIGSNVQVATGTGTVTFTTSTNSAATAVSHGLGRTPVFATAFNSTNNGVWFALVSKTSSQVSFGGWFFTSTSGTFPFMWLAIG